MVSRTFSRADWEAASAAWHEGGYDRDTWYEVRRAAADRGMLYPPQGSPHDDVDDPRPSQRAIVYRALDATPRALLAIIARSSSWTQVVDALIRDARQRRDELDAAELEEERRAEAKRFAGRQAAPALLADIMRKAGGS